MTTGAGGASSSLTMIDTFTLSGGPAGKDLHEAFWWLIPCSLFCLLASSVIASVLHSKVLRIHDSLVTDVLMDFDSLCTMSSTESSLFYLIVATPRSYNASHLCHVFFKLLPVQLHWYTIYTPWSWHNFLLVPKHLPVVQQLLHIPREAASLRSPLFVPCVIHTPPPFCTWLVHTSFILIPLGIPLKKACFPLFFAPCAIGWRHKIHPMLGSPLPSLAQHKPPPQKKSYIVWVSSLYSTHGAFITFSPYIDQE